VSRIVVGSLGVGLIGVGVWHGAAAVLAGVAEPIGTVAWWLAGPVLVDAVMVPVAAVIAYGITRRIPVPWRAPTAAALGVVLSLTVIAIPFVAGWGRKPANPSLLDRDYLSGYLSVVAVIVAVAAVWGGISQWRARRRVR